MKLSIIIPTYNVQDYLERCISSCLNQNIDINSYEIIVVNDGSQDKSLSIAQKLAAVYTTTYLSYPNLMQVLVLLAIKDYHWHKANMYGLLMPMML